jgi:hypothetical protein
MNDREMLERLQRESYAYFEDNLNEKNGLVADSSARGSHASIAAVGFGLSALVPAVLRGFLTRRRAAMRALRTLRFFAESPQSAAHDATGYKGFYYHFLDMETGERACDCELSTIDTALLVAGVLSVSIFFDGDDDDERAIRALAEEIHARVDWKWATNGRDAVSHGWMPDEGFLEAYWNDGYDEALILYVLALGSERFPISPYGYRGWTRTFEKIRAYDIEYLYAGPLFIHQFAHLWLDLCGIRDGCNRELGFDYFENSRRATLVHRKYAIENPLGFAGYSKDAWGITASDGPGPAVVMVDGVERTFYGYTARGVPFGPDDGTFSPWAVVASLPFAPDVVCDATRYALEHFDLKHPNGGFAASFNATYPERTRHDMGWIAEHQLGINQGPIVLAIENHASGAMWKLSRSCDVIVRGLRRAGFEGGWLDA